MLPGARRGQAMTEYLLISLCLLIMVFGLPPLLFHMQVGEVIGIIEQRLLQSHEALRQPVP